MPTDYDTNDFIRYENAFIRIADMDIPVSDVMVASDFTNVSNDTISRIIRPVREATITARLDFERPRNTEYTECRSMLEKMVESANKVTGWWNIEEKDNTKDISENNPALDQFLAEFIQ